MSDVTLTMKTICIHTNKGGAAKTTTAVNLAFNLRRRGNRVLLVDCDSQLGSSSFIVNKVNQSPALAQVLLGEVPIQEAISQTDSSWLGLSVLAGSADTSGAEIKLVSRAGCQNRLAQALEAVKNDYDYCVIDTPPAKGLIVLNALIASDYLVIPVSVGVLDFAGLKAVTEVLAEVQQYSNPKLDFMGILLTRWLRNKLAKDLQKTIRGLFPDKVFQSVVNEAVALGVAHGNHLPVAITAPDSPGSIAYLDFTNEVIRYEQNSKIRAAS